MCDTRAGTVPDCSALLAGSHTPWDYSYVDRITADVDIFTVGQTTEMRDLVMTGLQRYVFYYLPGLQCSLGIICTEAI